MQEKRLVAEIKKTAKTGNEVSGRFELSRGLLSFMKFYENNPQALSCPFFSQAATKILARQLVRLRQQIANLQGSRAQMRGIATHTQVNKSTASLN